MDERETEGVRGRGREEGGGRVGEGQIGRENQGGVKGRDKVESEMVRTR